MKDTILHKKAYRFIFVAMTGNNERMALKNALKVFINWKKICLISLKLRGTDVVGMKVTLCKEMSIILEGKKLSLGKILIANLTLHPCSFLFIIGSSKS